MADFNEYLAQLREQFGETEVPEPLFDNVVTEYQNVVTQRDGATVRLTESAERIAAQQAEIARLKGENYDLSIGSNGPTESVEEPKQQTGIAGLFTKRK